MFCENCGTKLTDDAKFCGECGAKTSMSHGEEKAKMISQSVSPSKKKKLFIGVAVAIAIATAIIAIIVFAVSANKPIDPGVIEGVEERAILECYETQLSDIEKLLDEYYPDLAWKVGKPNGTSELKSHQELGITSSDGLYRVFVYVDINLYSGGEGVGVTSAKLTGDIMLTDRNGGYKFTMMSREVGSDPYMYEGGYGTYAPYSGSSYNSYGYNDSYYSDYSSGYSGVDVYNNYDNYCGEYVLESENNISILVEEIYGDYNHLYFYYYVDDNLVGTVYASQTLDESWEHDAQFTSQTIDTNDQSFFDYYSNVIFMINSYGTLTIDNGDYYETFTRY